MISIDIIRYHLISIFHNFTMRFPSFSSMFINLPYLNCFSRSSKGRLKDSAASLCYGFLFLTECATRGLSESDQLPCTPPCESWSLHNRLPPFAFFCQVVIGIFSTTSCRCLPSSSSSAKATRRPTASSCEAKRT